MATTGRDHEEEKRRGFAESRHGGTQCIASERGSVKSEQVERYVVVQSDPCLVSRSGSMMRGSYLETVPAALAEERLMRKKGFEFGSRVHYFAVIKNGFSVTLQILIEEGQGVGFGDVEVVEALFVIEF